jgi:hypothetical protein
LEWPIVLAGIPGTEMAESGKEDEEMQSEGEETQSLVRKVRKKGS